MCRSAAKVITFSLAVKNFEILPQMKNFALRFFVTIGYIT